MKTGFLNFERQYAALVLPALIVFSLGMILPMLYGVYYSLSDWNGLTSNVAFTGILLSSIPILLFFLFTPKYYIKGIAAGALKG